MTRMTFDTANCAVCSTSPGRKKISLMRTFKVWNSTMELRLFQWEAIKSANSLLLLIKVYADVRSLWKSWEKESVLCFQFTLENAGKWFFTKKLFCVIWMGTKRGWLGFLFQLIYIWLALLTIMWHIMWRQKQVNTTRELSVLSDCTMISLSSSCSSTVW